jgi:hypothetical protein
MELRPLTILAALTLATMLTPVLPAVAGAKHQTQVVVRFYPQTGSQGGEFSRPVTLKHSGKQVFMGTMPLINERDVISAQTFPAADGSFGAYFKLDSHGTNLVMQHTLSQRGTFLFAFFNGRDVIDLYVDRPVQDGIIAIPRGLTPEEVALIDQNFPEIGQEGKKPKKVAPKPKPKPKPTPADER